MMKMNSSSPLYPSRSLAMFYGYDENGELLEEGLSGEEKPSQVELWNKYNKENPIKAVN